MYYKRAEWDMSDHRPIAGGFIVTVQKVDWHKRSNLEQEFRKNRLAQDSWLKWRIGLGLQK